MGSHWRRLASWSILGDLWSCLRDLAWLVAAYYPNTVFVIHCISPFVAPFVVVTVYSSVGTSALFGTLLFGHVDI